MFWKIHSKIKAKLTACLMLVSILLFGFSAAEHHHVMNQEHQHHQCELLSALSNGLSPDFSSITLSHLSDEQPNRNAWTGIAARINLVYQARSPPWLLI